MTQTRQPRGPHVPWTGDTAYRMGHPARKTVIVRALAEVGQNNSRCLANFLLQQSRAGAARHSNRAVSTLRPCGPPTKAEPPPSKTPNGCAAGARPKGVLLA